jgi:predicted aspartyl protease
MNRRDLEQLVDEELAQSASVVGTPGPLLVDVVLRGDCDKKRRCRELHGKGKIDTGASGTFIDKSAVKKLRLRRVGRRKMRGMFGKKMKARDVYGVELAFPGQRLDDVSLMEKGAGLRNKSELALIGRDVMAASGMRLEYDARENKMQIKPKKRQTPLKKRQRRKR